MYVIVDVSAMHNKNNKTPNNNVKEFVPNVGIFDFCEASCNAFELTFIPFISILEISTMK